MSRLTPRSHLEIARFEPVTRLALVTSVRRGKGKKLHEETFESISDGPTVPHALRGPGGWLKKGR